MWIAKRAPTIGPRRLVALALVLSLGFPVHAVAQENLPGIVSGKKIAIFAGVAAGALVVLFWVAKRKKKNTSNPSVTPGRLDFGATLSLSRDAVMALPMPLALGAPAHLRFSFSLGDAPAVTPSTQIQTKVGHAPGTWSSVALDGAGR